MPLTRRTNGSSAQNLVTASWWNDFIDLLTGVMSDQLVTIFNTLILKRKNNAGKAPTLSTQSGGNLAVGTYTYAYSWVTADGLENVSDTANVTTTSSNKTVNITNILPGPAGTVSRKIYRSKVGGVGGSGLGSLYLIATLNNNTATTYLDSAADSTLAATALMPQWDTTSGALLMKGTDGSTQVALTPDRYLYANGGPLTLVMNNGSGSGNVTIGEFNAGGLWMYNGGVNSGQTLQTGANLVVGTNMQAGYSNADNTVTVLDAHYAFGLKLNGNQAFEINNGGEAIIAGATYSNNANGFDGFDFAECFECAEIYPAGTVVCPGTDGKMYRCSHENCPAAYIISKKPGFLAGQPNGDFLPVAIVGKVKAKTAYDIPARSLVCSDGRGGVRAVQKDEWSYSMGCTIEATQNGEVGILIRNMLVKGV